MAVLRWSPDGDGPPTLAHRSGRRAVAWSSRPAVRLWWPGPDAGMFERGGTAMRRWQPRTLAGTFLVLQLAVVALVLLVAAIVSVRQAQAQFRGYAAERILGAAESLASNPLVRERLPAADRGHRSGAGGRVGAHPVRGQHRAAGRAGPAHRRGQRPDAGRDPARAARRVGVVGPVLGRRRHAGRSAADRRGRAGLRRDGCWPRAARPGAGRRGLPRRPGRRCWSTCPRRRCCSGWPRWPGSSAPGCWPAGSRRRRTAWSRRRSPPWPTSGRRCCTRSGRACSAWTRPTG